MRRGTTPTNTFSVPIDLSAATVFITYAQSGRTVIEKTGADLTFDKYTIIDHAGSEMNGGHIWAVEDMQVGCGGFLCREGKPEKCYECTAIYLAQQNSNGYWYHGKKIVPDSNAVICVSCTDTDGWVYVAYFEFVGGMP